MTIGELLKQFLELTYHTALVVFYFAYFLVKGREDELVTYPSFSCIDDCYPGMPIPIGSPYTASTNVCCLHGVQSRPSLPSPAMQQNATVSTSFKEIRVETDSRWSIKNVGHWFQFMKADEQRKSQQQMAQQKSPILAIHSTHERATSSAIPQPIVKVVNQKPHKVQCGEAESWISRALRRYANIEKMPKIPAFLAKQPPQESEFDPFYEYVPPRSTRILKVITQSSLPAPVRLQQQATVSVIATAPVRRRVMKQTQETSTKLDQSPVSACPYTFLQKTKTEMPIQIPARTGEQWANSVGGRRWETVEHVDGAPGGQPAASSSISVAPAKNVAVDPAEVAGAISPTSGRADIEVRTLAPAANAEQTEGTNAGQQRKPQVAAKIFVPSVFQQHGETTVRMHLASRGMGLVSPEEGPVVEMRSGSAEPNQEMMSQVPTVPIILVHEENQLNDVHENKNVEPASADGPKFENTQISYLSPSAAKQAAPPVIDKAIVAAPSVEQAEPNFIQDEIWLLPFPRGNDANGETAVWQLSSGEAVAQRTPEEALLLTPVAAEETSADVAEQTAPVRLDAPGTTQFQELEKTTSPEAILVDTPSTLEYTSAVQSVERKPTVTDVSRQWPPPSNATGPEIVKDPVGKSEGEEEDTIRECIPLSKVMDISRGHLYDEGIAEKVRACQSIVHELKASSDSGTSQSRAQRMFSKRKQRAAKYVVCSPGPEVCPDAETRNGRETVQGVENGDQGTLTRKVRNPLGDVHDFQQMKRDYGDVVTNLASAEKCQEISQALKSQTSTGKGAEMFVRKSQEAKDWIVDEQRPLTPSSQSSYSAAASIASGEVSPNISNRGLQKQHSLAGLPPMPVPLDSLRPFRRELDRISSPTPTRDWTSHGHERLFSPIPFSSRVRAPSMERVAFSPPRPYTPLVFSDQGPQPTPPPRSSASYHSSAVIRDRYQRAIDTGENCISSLPPTSEGRSRYTLPPRMNSFNTLPRSWKSYSEAYRLRNSTEDLRQF